jgi:hypothetical protein
MREGERTGNRGRVSRCPVDCIYTRRMFVGTMWITALDFDIEHTYYQAQLKRCPRCGQTKPRSEFHAAKRRADGVQSVCKACRSEIDHARYERKQGRTVPRQKLSDRGRTAWMLSLKAGRPCSDCGGTYPRQVMQWDHLPGFEKLGDISTSSRGKPREAVLEEIAKCELVCANCHALRTFRRNGWGAWSLQELRPGYDAQRSGRSAA